MRKLATISIAILTLILGVVALTACVPGVSGEEDLYGTYFVEKDGYLGDSRCITLKEGNIAALESADGQSWSYYAKYDLVKGIIELRDGDYRGEIIYTIRIKDMNNLELVQEVYDDDGAVYENTLTFVRDSDYDVVNNATEQA